MDNNTVLIVDDEIELCRSLKDVLEDRGLRCTFTTRPRKALELATGTSIGACVMDVRMPEIGGIELLEKAKAINPDIPVVMVTGYPNVKSTVSAMRLGALNVFSKPIDIDSLVGELKQVLDKRNAAPQGAVHLKRPPRTRSPRVRDIEARVKKVARTEASVLVCGESGTGKERVATEIHGLSRRSSGPFVKINCAAIPETLLESELFGHTRGAFTDAVTERIGTFERAKGGTIFLDEIGDMSLPLQAKILRAVQEQEFERIGGGTVRTDVRIICASNRDLAALVRSGTFREDLYYRLAVVTLDLLPLRDRAEDIEPLFVFFLDYYSRLYRTVVPAVDPDVLRILHRHDWPGNIRELKNVAERAVIFAEGGTLRRDDLPAQYRSVRVPAAEETYAAAAEIFDRRIIQDALARAEGNRQIAAEMLQIHRKTLYNKMRRLGIR